MMIQDTRTCRAKCYHTLSLLRQCGPLHSHSCKINIHGDIKEPWLWGIALLVITPSEVAGSTLYSPPVFLFHVLVVLRVPGVWLLNKKDRSCCTVWTNKTGTDPHVPVPKVTTGWDDTELVSKHIMNTRAGSARKRYAVFPSSKRIVLKRII